MSKKLFGIFAKAKRATDADDAFERTIAPKLNRDRDRYKRAVDIASNKLREAMEKLEAELGDGETVPVNQALAGEHERRVRMIAENEKLLESCMKLLDRWPDQSQGNDESVQQYRAMLREAIGDAFPKLQSRLSEIEVRNQLELGKLQIENGRVVKENLEMRSAASKSLGASEIPTRLEGFLEGRLSAPAAYPAASTAMEKKINDLVQEKSQLEIVAQQTDVLHKSALDEKDRKIERLASKKDELKEALDDARLEVKSSARAVLDLENDVRTKELRIMELEAELKLQTDLVSSKSVEVGRIQGEMGSQLAQKQSRIEEQDDDKGTLHLTPFLSLRFTIGGIWSSAAWPRSMQNGI